MQGYEILQLVSKISFSRKCHKKWRRGLYIHTGENIHVVYIILLHPLLDNRGRKVIMDKCRIIFILAERIIYRSRGHGLFATTSLSLPPAPLLSLFASCCISLTLTLLQCHSKWAYRQLEGSRHWELHIARVFITLALTFTQMDRQSSFVFIFSQPSSLSLSLWLSLSLPPPLAMKLVASEVCHPQRSFKVADMFYVDGPITITTTTTFDRR